MRVVAEIQHPQVKITIFHWNNRYLVKLESGLLEQTYKVAEFDVTSEDDVKKMIDDKFIREALDRFDQMAVSLQRALADL